VAKKPKNDKGIMNKKDQLQGCIDVLKEHGYGVFELGESESEKEQEAIEKLRSVGYKVEHIKDMAVRIEPQKISSADDIAVYFYERLRRFNPQNMDPDKLKDKKHRLVDCSVINTLIKWRMGEGMISLTEAIEDVFVMIDVLFEKAQEWNLAIYSTGILSVHNSKPLVLTLLREANLRRDAKLEYEINYTIHTEDAYNYINMLDAARDRINNAKKPVLKKERRKIKV
jgi:hypothetical protein